MRRKTLSLLSFNTLGTTFFAPDIRLRYKAIAETIIKRNIDIICFQEISTYYNLQIMKRYLQEYPFCLYSKHITGPKGGLVLFSKIPVENTSYYQYKTLGSYTNITFYTKIIRNGILKCTLTDIPLTILNTHLVSDFTFAEDTSNLLFLQLKKQIDEAIHVVNTISKTKSVLLTGDFNMARDLSLYKDFIQKTEMKDVFSQNTEPTYDPERMRYRFAGKRPAIVDYIFLKQNTIKFDKIHTERLFDKPVELTNKKITYLSDHIGLHISYSMDY